MRTWRKHERSVLERGYQRSQMQGKALSEAQVCCARGRGTGAKGQGGADKQSARARASESFRGADEPNTGCPSPTDVVAEDVRLPYEGERIDLRQARAGFATCRVNLRRPFGAMVVQTGKWRKRPVFSVPPPCLSCRAYYALR
jgi:hypothetical protein